MFSDAIFTLAGAIFAGLIILHINSYNVIKKKTKAEAIQKLKLDSMIEVINGAKELRSAANINHILMSYIVRDMLVEIKTQNYSQIGRIVNEARDEFFKDSREANEKIINFSYLLARDFAINEEISREHGTIRKKFTEIRDIFHEMMMSIDKVKKNEINEQNISSIGEDLINLTYDKNGEVINFSVHIIFIYTVKLDKEQESLFGNFLKIVGLSKIMNSLKKLLRNRENEDKLESFLKLMEQKEEPSAIEQSETSS